MIFALMMGLTCAMIASEVITLPELKAPGIIDGDLSDPCWAKAYKTGPFHLVSGKKISEKTEGFLFRDKEAFYVAIRCYFDDYAAKDNKLKTYYENLMYRLVLHGGSHREEEIKSMHDFHFFELISKEEKVRTAKDILCFIFLLNKKHVLTHLSACGSNAEKTIQSWCNDIINRTTN